MGVRPRGDEWAWRVFGEPGAKLRRLVPHLVRSAHHDMANAQESSNLEAHLVYGAIWRRTLDEFARVIPREIPGATLVKPKRASYKIVKVSGVPLYPWRYAKDLTIDPETVRLGNPPSDTRVAIFSGGDLGHEQLALDFGSPEGRLVDLPHPEEELETAEAVIAELADQSPMVVAVQYASNPSALLRVRWCDAVLRDDGTIASEFAEDLDLPGGGAGSSGAGGIAVGDPWGRLGPGSGGPSGTFSDTPLADPRLRPRGAR